MNKVVDTGASQGNAQGKQPGPILDVRHLETSFSTSRGLFRAIDDVSFTLNRGEILGIVGESGCGKSVTAQSIMRLLPEPWGKISGGSILFHEKDLVHLSLKEMSTIRGNRIAMIFQEPMTALNPVKTIGYQIGEMFWLHRGCSRQKGLQKATEILEKVHIPEPAKRIHNYPHQLSGGMRQRAMIAMALSCEPEILIADEPTTALDVTVQAQIIDLMIDLRQASQTAIIMITHDLGVIAEMAHRVMVMYAGQVVESAHSLALFESPRHPYTIGLLASLPRLGEQRRSGRRKRLQEIPGSVPSMASLLKGCLFAPRCSRVVDHCRNAAPRLREIRPGHQLRCWNPPGTNSHHPTRVTAGGLT